MKKFARIRGTATGLTRIYYVDDPDDLERIKDCAAGQLGCHVGDCAAVYKKPIENKTGTRYLAAMPGRGCEHGLARPDLGGGRMSDEHLWIQHRLLKVLSMIVTEVFPDRPDEPVLEHPASHADLYVVQTKLALEVQRWPTDFRERAAARQQDGGQVIWLVTEKLAPRAWRAGVFTDVPAVTIAYEDPHDRERLLTPWASRADHRAARLKVYGNVARLHRGQLVTGREDAFMFLREVIEGERVWYPATSRLIVRGKTAHYGIWARPEDVSGGR